MGWLGVAFGFGLSFGVVIYMFGAPPRVCCLESAWWRRPRKAALGHAECHVRTQLIGPGLSK